MKHNFILLSLAAVVDTIRNKTENRLTIKSNHCRSLPGVLPASNPFAGGVTGVLLVLCLWLVPAMLPVNRAAAGTVAWGLNDKE